MVAWVGSWDIGVLVGLYGDTWFRLYDLWYGEWVGAERRAALTADIPAARVRGAYRSHFFLRFWYDMTTPRDGIWVLRFIDLH